jgi:sporulation protein YlmC with PRC-barrel domain
MPVIYAGPATYYGNPAAPYAGPVQNTVPIGTTVSVPAGSTATITSPTGVMTTVGGPYVAGTPMTEAVNLSARSDLIGRPVINSTGHQLGNVEYVAVVPSTNEVRYVVVGGDVFGAGNRIFVPIYQTHLAGGRVVLDAPDATLMQAQRFQRSELQQFYIVN